MWAAFYLMQETTLAPAVVHTDSMNVVRAITGITPPHPKDKIGRLACALWVQLRSKRCVDICHVKGHVGHPWNTLADWLAGAVLSEKVRATEFSAEFLELTLYQKTSEWDWLLGADEATRRAYPVELGGTNDLEPICRAAESQFERLFEPLSQSQEASAEPLQVSLRVAQYNARIANDKLTYGKAGKQRRARAKSLRLQMATLGALVVGAQEARTPRGTRRADDYYIISTGPDSQGLGVELWINVALPYATRGQRKYCFEPRHFRVLARTSRILIVRAEAPAVSEVFLVAHAPHCKVPAAERAAF